MTRRSAVLACVFLSALGAAPRADDAKPSGDLKKMQGTWLGDSGPESRWVFEGETLKASVNGEDYTCSLKLEPGATPHPAAVLTIKQGPGAGGVSKAIYKFDGDRLVFCVAHPGDDDRPTEFKAVDD